MGRQSRVSTQILDALLIQEKPNVVVLDEVKKCSMLKLLTSFVLTFFFLCLHTWSFQELHLP